MSNKIIRVTVEVIVNHLDSVPALLQEVAQNISNENDNGTLEKEDGDKIVWRTK